jgi:hypothetical protein
VKHGKALAALFTALLLNTASGCTLIAAGVAVANDAKDGTQNEADSKAPVTRLETAVKYSEPANRREK